MQAFRFEEKMRASRSDLLPPERRRRDMPALSHKRSLDIIDVHFETLPAAQRSSHYRVFNDNRRNRPPASGRRADRALALLETTLRTLSGHAFAALIILIGAGVFALTSGLVFADPKQAEHPLDAPALAFSVQVSPAHDRGLKMLSVSGFVQASRPIEIIAGGRRVLPSR